MYVWRGESECGIGREGAERMRERGMGWGGGGKRIGESECVFNGGMRGESEEDELVCGRGGGGDCVWRVSEERVCDVLSVCISCVKGDCVDVDCRMEGVLLLL